MNQVAFLYGNTAIYWGPMILSMAALAGILFFLAASLRRSEAVAAAASCPVMVVLSVLFCRFLHWYFLPDSYENIAAAMTDFKSGGYVLLGAFPACILTAWVLKQLHAVKNLPFFLDCMSIGGCAAIALGRLSFFFSSSDRGDILFGLTDLPWASAVVNVTSGAVEYRFAAFFVQALAAGCIFLVILFRFYQKHRDGDIAITFLLLYCAAQAVLDSTRYDAVRLRSNGFISVVQLVCAVCLVGIIALLSVRLIKHTGFQPWYTVIWVLTASGIGGAAYMEYYVQRHSGEALFAYLTMSGCLAVTVAAGILLLCLTNRRKHRFLKT